MASGGLISHIVILTDSQDAPECLCGSVLMPEGSKVCGGPIVGPASAHRDPRESGVMGMGPMGMGGLPTLWQGPGWFTTPALGVATPARGLHLPHTLELGSAAQPPSTPTGLGRIPASPRFVHVHTLRRLR